MAEKQKLILTGWNSYRRMLPADAGKVQIEETRCAFYGGAHWLFGALMMTLEPGNEATPGDLTRVQAIHDELLEFTASLVEAGKAS